MNKPAQPPVKSSSSTPLPPGWTQHIAPSGHYYYFNKATKESTYDRPRLHVAQTSPAIAKSVSHPPHLAQPAISAHPQHNQRPTPEQTNWQAAYTPGFQQQQQRDGQRRQRKPRKREVPRLLRPLSLEPWLLVVTNLGRPFVHNARERVSIWLPPPEVQAAVDTIPKDELIMMVARCRGFSGGRDGARKLVRKARVESQKGSQQMPVEIHKEESTGGQLPYEDEDLDDAALLAEAEMSAAANRGIIRQRNRSPSGSEEQESEEESDDDGESTADEEDEEEEVDKGAVEFNEDDIEWQIQAMMEENPELLEGADDNDEEVPYEERIKVFRELLVDANVNPYSPWDTEMPKVATDQRYIILETLSERKAVFENWSKERITELKAQRANEPKFDPKEQFLELLRQYATPKLFYQEFKRKYRKEPIFKDSSLTDREKEKIYREYVKKK
ncbi:hypothetical protein POJ06DRAFT_8669 [Lipomyces tetrasporus]|uniref:WW domain-containing protein n=1 Tax=Lipomyces tetrasporus TaxID=54092 RepID=A0AAD7VWS2_9ASCO|nr:uncharacterized protein POJ06DRAFT_8669 [Lipomyces tetrasporus]KAJ8103870.1 hypothetical protein POJ06DRAFT_8669 [Lipomyces tetrasporus]